MINKVIFKDKLGLHIIGVLFLIILSSCNTNVSYDTELSIPRDKSIITGKLDNGLTYYLRRNTKPENRIFYNLAVKVGSIHETEEEQGIAHYLEHMAFNGSKNFTGNELINYAQEQGMAFGADVNAYTSFDRTVYRINFPADDPEVTNKALLILEDWAHNLNLNPTQVESEKGVVISEWRNGQGVEDRVFRQQLPLILEDSHYADRVPIGTRESIESFDAAMLRAFYEKWYHPSKMALVIVGDFNLKEMENQIKDRFNWEPKGPEPMLDEALLEVPILDRGDPVALTVKDDELTKSDIAFFIKHPRINVEATSSWLSSNLVDMLIDSIFASRMDDISSTPSSNFELAYGSQRDVKIGDASFTIMGLLPKPGKDEASYRQVLENIQLLLRHGVLSQELETAKTGIKANIELLLENYNKIESDSFVSDILSEIFAEDVLLDPTWLRKNFKAMIDPITVEQINERLNSNFSSSDTAIIASLPSSRTGLSAKELVSLYKESFTWELAAPNLLSSIETLLESKPEPGRIISETRDRENNVVTWELENGISVQYKNTKFEKDTVRVLGTRAGGLSLVSDADYFNARYSIDVVYESGLADFSLPVLQNYLDGKNLSYNLNIDDSSVNFEGAGSVKNLEDLMQLIYLYAVEYNLDPEVLASKKELRISQIEDRFNDPYAVFGNDYSAMLYNNNFRELQDTREDIENLDLERMRSLYKSLFTNMDNYNFSFVSNIPAAKFKRYVQDYLAAIPKYEEAGLDEQPPIYSLYAEKANEGVLAINTEPKADVRISWVRNDLDSSSPELSIELETLAQMMEIRLIEVLREEFAGSYSPGVFALLRVVPSGQAIIHVYFGAEPNRFRNMLSYLDDILAEFRTGSFSQELLDKVKLRMQRDIEVDSKTNEYWLNMLNDLHLWNSFYPDEQIALTQYINRKNSKIESLSRSDIQSLAQVVLDDKKRQQFVLAPKE